MRILGIHSSFTGLSHDPSACMLTRAGISVAVEEERLLRQKSGNGRFPDFAIQAILDRESISMRDVDYIAYDGITYSGLDYKIRRQITDRFHYCPELFPVDHSESHCRGAYYSSGFDDALVCSFDGSGDKVSSRLFSVRAGKFEAVHSTEARHSLGNFYTLFTNYLGFKSIEGEYKVMGMAAYGSDNGQLNNSLYFDESQERLYFDSALIDMEYVTSIYEPTYSVSGMSKYTKCPRPENGRFIQEHFDLACSVQATFARAYIGYIKHFMRKTGHENLVLSGGCSLNVLANMEVANLPEVRRMYVFPASSDRGLCIGNAYACAAARYGDCDLQPLKTMSLGLEYDAEAVRRSLANSGLIWRESGSIYRETVDLLVDGKVLGWFQGRSEFGPRALGNRSIIALPTLSGIKDKVNAKIKFREQYRPFAPAILLEDFREILNDADAESPFMTRAFDVSRYADVFGETIHVDGTARVQTVDTESNPYFEKLLRELKARTGNSCVLNTSFNLAGEPIVESPIDAIRTFVSSGLDILIMGNFIVMKNGE